MDDSKPVDELEEISTKSAEEMMEDGAHCLALGKYSEAVQHYSLAVQTL